jgi:hypothetical protein
MAVTKPLKIGHNGVPGQFDATDTLPIANLAVASQVEAEAGVATDKVMTPERTAQAIAALGGGISEAKALMISTLRI